MVALETALERPAAVRAVVPMAAPAATGALAMAWNAIQLEMIAALGEDGLALARQLAMTTYRSASDFDGRFGRQLEPDGRLSIASYLSYQGRKLVERFDPDTYRILVRAMDLHDIGRGGAARLPRWARWRPAAPGSSGWGSRTTSCTDRPRSTRWSTRRPRLESRRPTAS